MAEQTQKPWMVEGLGSQHDRSAFDCGQASLNDWLKLRAGQFAKRDLARTYVLVRADEVEVFGYYALSTHHVRFESLPGDQSKGLPHSEIPVVLLGRLAVDRSVRGQGLGKVLLVDSLRRVQHLADHVGVRGMEVDALDDSARAFYIKFGFVPLLDDPNHLFLSMKVIRKLHLPAWTDHP